MTGIGVGIVVADKEGILTDVSPTAAALLNAEREQLIGKTPEQAFAFIKHPLFAEGAGYVQVAPADGKKHNCWVECYPYLARDGTKGGTLWLICDVAETSKTVWPLEGEKNAASQGLTGKGNGADNFRLTRRQLQVLVLIADGGTYKEAAARLGIGERTVKYHVQSAIDKLHLQNRLQLVSYAAKSGLLK